MRDLTSMTGRDETFYTGWDVCFTGWTTPYGWVPQARFDTWKGMSPKARQQFLWPQPGLPRGDDKTPYEQVRSLSVPLQLQASCPSKACVAQGLAVLRHTTTISAVQELAAGR